MLDILGLRHKDDSGDRQVRHPDPGRTRTCNPRLRRPMPYPSGHGAMFFRETLFGLNCIFSFFHRQEYFQVFCRAIHCCARHARFEKLRALMGYRILCSPCLTPGLFYSATSGSPQCHRLHFCLQRRHGVLGPLRPCKAIDQGQTRKFHTPFALQSQLGPRRNQICNIVGFASCGSNL